MAAAVQTGRVVCASVVLAKRAALVQRSASALILSRQSLASSLSLQQLLTAVVVVGQLGLHAVRILRRRGRSDGGQHAVAGVVVGGGEVERVPAAVRDARALVVGACPPSWSSTAASRWTARIGIIAVTKTHKSNDVAKEISKCVAEECVSRVRRFFAFNRSHRSNQSRVPGQGNESLTCW